MGQLGHTDPAITLGIYAQEMDRRDGETERLKKLVTGDEWTANGQPTGETTEGSNGKTPAEPISSGLKRP
jgi:hypothetical protein